MDAVEEYGPGAFQDAGDALTLAAVPIGATGIGLPLAEVMAGVGSTMSLIGTSADILNDAAEGHFSIKKTATKILLQGISRKLNTPDAFGPVEQIVNDNIFNGLDRTIDEIDRQKKIF